MKRNFAGRRPGLTWELVLAGTLVASAALAQGPGGPPFGGPPPFGRPGGGPPPPATVAGAPLSFLDAKLKLSSDQEAKIKQIQQDFRQQREALRPPRPMDGPPPDRSMMDGNRDKAKKLDDAAIAKIKAVLTASQKTALDETSAELEALRADAIPLEVYGDLKLTADQEKQLTKIGTAAAQARKAAVDKARQSGDFQSARDTMQQSRQQTHEKVAAILSGTQRQTLEKFRQSHPRPEARRGFGFGGPPPPDGMGPQDENGPPPPDGNGPPPPDGGGPSPDDGGPPPPGF